MTIPPSDPPLPPKRRLSRREYLISAAAVVTLLLIWFGRWWIGGKAVEIVDPVIRRWASGQVNELSEGAYQLTISPMNVDVGARRVGIDTIIVITDAAANARRAAPLPAVTLRFLNCSFEGLDLDRLTAGRGIHATRAGCDSVSISAEVPRGVARDTTSGAFLSLRQNLDLPRSVPFIRIDTVAFPQVAMAMGITGRSGHRTALAFDRLAVHLDSLHYDRDQPPGSRSTLFSRNVTLLVEGFEGSRELANRLVVNHLKADLSNGTLEVLGLDWEPVQSYADSLGLSALAVDTLRLTGIDWSSFLTSGDVDIRHLQLRGGRLRLPPGAPDTPAARSLSSTPAPRSRTLESQLRALSRGIVVDTMSTDALSVVQSGTGRDSVITTLGKLVVTGFDIGYDSARWAGRDPLGKVTVSARDLLRRAGESRLALGQLEVNLAAGTVVADSFRLGHFGSLDAFVRGRRQRKDRVEVRAARLTVSGADAAAHVREGSYRFQRADLTGFVVDIFSDKNLLPGPPKHRRSPQEWIRQVGLALDIDTIQIEGRALYRERGVNRAVGELRFDQLRATLINLSTDPQQQSAARPLRFVTTSRLMGVGDFRVELRIPLLAPDFRMAWNGSLGPMPAPALNPLMIGIADITFKEGRILGIQFEATTTAGMSRGTVAPRWDSLFVETPGMARTGVLGGVRRALAKFAANQFVVRDANRPGGSRPPVDGVLAHEWVPRETLIQHLWFTLRDALLPMVTR